jgi:hypothetical protein
MPRVLQKRWLGILLAMCLVSDAIAVISFLAERRDHEERHSQIRSSTPQHLDARYWSDSYGEQSCTGAARHLSAGKLPGNHC